MQRELVITVPLPEDRGRRGDARPNVHRFRSYNVQLGRRLRASRGQHGLTQVEVAAVVGAGTSTSVTQWESGARVPEGGRRQRVEALVGGRLWPELRAAVVAGTGMPARWAAAVRWYRRASRARARRAGEGTAIASILEHLRDTLSPEVLRQRYATGGAGWAPTPGVVPTHGPGGAVLRQIEDASFGLRWLEIARGGRLDLSRSLVHQLYDGGSAPRGTRAQPDSRATGERHRGTSGAHPPR